MPDRGVTEGPKVTEGRMTDTYGVSPIPPTREELMKSTAALLRIEERLTQMEGTAPSSAEPV